MKATNRTTPPDSKRVRIRPRVDLTPEHFRELRLRASRHNPDGHYGPYLSELLAQQLAREKNR